MLKVILTLILLMLSLPVYSLNNAQILELAEKTYFNCNFEQEPVDNRLERLESFIYGKAFKDSYEKRFKRIKKLIKTNKNKINNDNVSHNNNEENYPIVSEFERKVFGAEFINEDINSRLERLELNTFGSSFPNEGLITRIGRIKEVIGISAGNLNDMGNVYSCKDNSCDNNILPPLNKSNPIKKMFKKVGSFFKSSSNIHGNSNYNTGNNWGYSGQSSNFTKTPFGTSRNSLNRNMGFGSSVQVLK